MGDRTTMLVWLLLVGLADAKIFVPFAGPVKIATNLPVNSVQVQVVLAVFKNAVDDVRITSISRGSRFCQRLDVQMKSGLFIAISDNGFEVCRLKLRVPFIQVLTGGNDVGIAYQSATRDFHSNRFRFEPQMLAQLLKSVFFDHITDHYLNRGEIKFKDVLIKHRATWMTVDLSTWQAVFLGIFIAVVLQSWMNGQKRRNETIHEILAEKTGMEESAENGTELGDDSFRKWMQTVTELVVDLVKRGNDPAEVPSGDVEVPDLKADQASSIRTVFRDFYTQIQNKLRIRFPMNTEMTYFCVLVEALSSLVASEALSSENPFLNNLKQKIASWVAKALAVPQEFCANFVFCESNLESTFWSMKTAEEFCKTKDEKSVVYCGQNAEHKFEQILKFCPFELRVLENTKTNLEAEIKKDLERGLKPFFVHATLGTTATCTFDDLKEITQIAKKHNLWVHVDAAYAGNAFVCPEFRYLMDGIEHADSININLHKMFGSPELGHLLFCKSSVSLPQENTKQLVKALKTWFYVKFTGKDGLETHVRRSVKCGEKLAELISGNPRLKILERKLWQVIFKVEGDDAEKARNLTADLASVLKKFRQFEADLVRFGEEEAICFSVDIPRMNPDLTDQANLVRDSIDDFFDNQLSTAVSASCISNRTSPATRSESRFSMVDLDQKTDLNRKN